MKEDKEFPKKKHHNGVEYGNGGFFRTGIITNQWRKKYKHPIPKCDTVYLEIASGDRKNRQGFVLTVDEMAAIAMLMTETVWSAMEHIERI